MPRYEPLRDVVDLLDGDAGTLTREERASLAESLRSGDFEPLRRLNGQTALVVRDGLTVRLARTLHVPLRYFVAKLVEGPCLVAAHRVDEIRDWLAARGLQDQFHPTYTRMAPAHHVTEVSLVGCPDPRPVHRRFAGLGRERLPADIDAIGEAYVGALRSAIDEWLDSLPPDEPIGVAFSGGIDSGAVLLLLHDALLDRGESAARLKAFTLGFVDTHAADIAQAIRFLEATGLEFLHEVIEAPAAAIDVAATVALIEDYKPLDVQAAAMVEALAAGIRRRYPDWRHLADGDGGDENLKDYPIEVNPELTIRSVVNNPLLYQEGWGVESLKHSQTYSGGLSRASTRTFAPLRRHGMRGFSPHGSPRVVEVAAAIPFAELAAGSHETLYGLKGRIIAAGIRRRLGREMPVFEKRRFQHGAIDPARLGERIGQGEAELRRLYQQLMHA